MATLPALGSKYSNRKYISLETPDTSGASSDWSRLLCLSDGCCTGFGTIQPTAHKRPVRDLCGFTESQAMGLALILAEQYVLVSEQCPAEEAEFETQPLVAPPRSSSSSHSVGSASPHPTLSPASTSTPTMYDYNLSPSSFERHALLAALPRKSTRSRTPRSRITSTGSTVCDNPTAELASGAENAADSPARNAGTWRTSHTSSAGDKPFGTRSRLLKRPVRWIRRVLG